MISIEYSPKFLRKLKRLEVSIQKKAEVRIGLFKERKNHQVLRVHKLHGLLSNRHAFSVDHKYRVVFKYNSDNDVALLSIDDHDIYK
ncbi:MAG: hypothetical protein AAB660_02430 [Patescibacteria group bacterium]